MSEFTLDTAGAVAFEGRPTGDFLAPDHVKWSDLDAFTQGYIEAMFFTSGDEPGTLPGEGDGDQEGERITYEVGFADLAPDTLAKIIADCENFQAASRSVHLAEGVIGHAIATARGGDYSEEQAGRDFWFTRNGHGVGFWDRSQLQRDVIAALMSICRDYRETDAYLGNDGKVHLS